MIRRDDNGSEAQYARARAWLAIQRHRRTTNYRHTTYGLKHAAEGNWPGAVYTNYVGEPVLLVAARDLGFMIRRTDGSSFLNIADPLVLPPAAPCFCSGPEPPTKICKECIRERSAIFLDDPTLWRRLKRERDAAAAKEFWKKFWKNRWS